MSEMVKTLTFVGVCAVVLITAVVTRPVQEVIEETQVGVTLFPDFKQPDQAASLKIVEVSEENARVKKFEVARDRKSQAWLIPTSFGYPADALEQMQAASLAFIDLKALGIASEVVADHEVFGVVQPDEAKVQDTKTGLGKLIQVRDKNGKNLARLIVGKKVKNTNDQRFVRIPEKNQVYVVKFDPGVFSTRFEDWIDLDLLKLNTLDLERVAIRDYSVLIDNAKNVTFEERLEVTAGWNWDQSQWQFERLAEFIDGKPVAIELKAGETINSLAFDELRSSLGSLKIVGVWKKPDGLGADLRAEKDFLDNEENSQSLIKRGFYPLRLSDGSIQFRSANGEVTLTLRDGVQYVLRFGETAGFEQDSEGSGRDQVTRYLLVTAQVDTTRFPEPEYQPVPQRDPNNEDPDFEIKRDAVLKANQRLKDAWEEEVGNASVRVRALNDRFANWYYIVSESEYQKILLSRDQVIKQPEPAESPEATTPESIPGNPTEENGSRSSSPDQSGDR